MDLLRETVRVMLEARLPSLEELIKGDDYFMGEWEEHFEDSGIDWPEDEAERKEEIRGYIERELEDLYDDAWNAVDQLREGTRLWRCMTLPRSADPESLPHYGIYWSNDESQAECHWGKYGKGQIKYTFEIELIDLDAVDVEGTMRARLQPGTGEAEGEITLKEGAQVLLLSYYSPSGGEAVEKVITI